MTATKPAATPGIETVTSHILPTGAPDAVTSRLLTAGAPDAVTDRILPAGAVAGPGLAPPGQADSQADGQAHLDLPTVVTAARDARHFTMATLNGWQLPSDTISPAKTIVTELVTNAYKAARSAEVTGFISLTLRRLPGQIVIEVSDNGPGLPAKSGAAGNAENGRGLLIVEALSQEWGYQPKRCGKVVYAIIRVPP